MELVGWLKILDDNNNATDGYGRKSILVLMILEKVKEKRLKISQRRVTVSWKKANYEEVRFTFTNNRFKKSSMQKTIILEQH